MTRWLLHSNHPEEHSGYAEQIRQFAWHVLVPLYGKENIAFSAFHGQTGYMSEWRGMPVYPAGQDAWGGDIVGMHAVHFNADIIFSLMDNWALSHETLVGKNHVAWIPIDCSNPHNPQAALGIHDTNRLMGNPGTVCVAISRFGYEVLEAARKHLLLPNRCLYAPHAIDTDVFRPFGDPAQRAEVRRAMKITDRFAVLTVSANRDKSRKNFTGMAEAFRRFHLAHQDPAKGPVPVWILHTEEWNKLGHNLPQLFDRIGLPKDAWRFSAQYLQTIGEIPDWQLAGTMAAADVGLQCSMAEGFGLPIAEIEACGTPVITTCGSSMTEVCGPGGWAVSAEDAWATGHEAWWRMPHNVAIVKALEQAYAKGQAYQARRKAARPHIEGNYAVDAVRDKHWAPVLGQIHDHFGLDDDRRVDVAA